jgi:hypothetical protein
MARKARRDDVPQQENLPFATAAVNGDAEAEDAGGDEEVVEEVVEEGKIICALTGERRTASDQERTLQATIEQLHREYGSAFGWLAMESIEVTGLHRGAA